MITTQEFSLRLQERIVQIWFDAKEMLEAEGNPDAAKLAGGPDVFPDGPEIDQIAEYLIEDEEFAVDINDEMDLDRALTIGMFIHGWIHRNDPL